MPVPTEHLKQVKSNENLANTLATGGFLDWAATVYFYAAVHLVAAYFFPIKHDRHQDRTPAVHRDPLLHRIFGEYSALKTMSEDARYDCYVVRPEDMPQIKQDYEALKAFVLPKALKKHNLS